MYFFTSNRWEIIKNVELHLVGQSLTSFFPAFSINMSVALTDLFTFFTSRWTLFIAIFWKHQLVKDLNYKLKCMDKTTSAQKKN